MQDLSHRFLLYVSTTLCLISDYIVYRGDNILLQVKPVTVTLPNHQEMQKTLPLWLGELYTKQSRSQK